MPFAVGGEVCLADVRKEIESLDFDIFVPKHLSEEDVNRLKQWRYALVHKYEAGNKADENSKELVQRVSVGLRIIRPTRQPFYYLQAHLVGDSNLQYSSFTHPGVDLLVPHAEGLNRIRNRDALDLRQIASALLKAYSSNCRPVMRAIRNLEVGYASRFSDVQFLLWVTGLDALFTSREWEHRGKQVVVERVKHFLARDFPIYRKDDLSEFEEAPNWKVATVIEDVYTLRNHFAHGDWVPEEWFQKPGRSYLEKNISYDQTLVEAAGVLIRASLKKIPKEDLISLFGDKQKMNAYFARHSLVRLAKKSKQA